MKGGLTLRHLGVPLPISLDAGRLPHRKVALALACAAFFVYNANCRRIESGDTVGASLIPITLLTQGNLEMSAYERHFLEKGYALYFFMHTRFGVLPLFPLATGFLAVPLYAIPVLAYNLTRPSAAQWVAFASVADKICGSIFTAISVAVFCLLALRLGASQALSCALSLAFAFSSQAWSTSSQGLWQHGPGALFLLTSALLGLRHADKASARLAFAFGLSCAIAVCIRLPNALFILPLFGLVSVYQPRRALISLIPVVALGAALIIYNVLTRGDPRGYLAYNVGTYGDTRVYIAHPFSTPILDGLLGVLLSPGKGLFVYFPLALLGIIGLPCALIKESRHRAFFAVVAVYLGFHLVLVSKLCAWWGGWCYGPRYMTEAQPFLLLAAIPWLSRSKHGPFRVFAFAMMFWWGVGIQGVGAFLYPRQEWNKLPVNVDWAPERLWDWRDNPIGRELSPLWRSFFTPARKLTSWNAEYLVSGRRICRPGELLRLPVVVKNTGSEAWPFYGRADGASAVNLSYHIRTADGRMLQFDGNRSLLGGSVSPGESYRAELVVEAPGKEGAYTLEISLVQEFVAWFDEKGVAPAKVELEVVARSEASSHSARRQ